MSVMQTQTTFVETKEKANSPKPQPKKAEPKKVKKGPKKDDLRERAVRLIVNFYKRKMRLRREKAFHESESSVLLSRKRKYNPVLEAIEIMSLYLVQHHDGRAKCLKFTVFNYATKHFSYQGVYEKMRHLTEFQVDDLKMLCEPSLEILPFEKSPFQQHILCI